VEIPARSVESHEGHPVVAPRNSWLGMFMPVLCSIPKSKPTTVLTMHSTRPDIAGLARTLVASVASGLALRSVS